jgi:hypothetical protein
MAYSSFGRKVPRTEPVLADFQALEAGDREHVEHALGDVLAQLVQQRMRAGALQIGDDFGDRLADAGQLAQAIIRNLQSAEPAGVTIYQAPEFTTRVWLR